ncbi:MAG: hydroxyacylglutathione hydrolase [Deltaproteobacteria bacterium]|nr:hydroxyacylglutathione hydrolase [Deltaproteobacteria bacterium]
MDVVSIPILSDNYAHLLIDSATRQAAVVDPGEAAPVLIACRERNLVLEAILATHHHADHVDGIESLLEAFPSARVIGADAERIPRLSERVGAGSKISAAGATGEVLDVRCHTRTHVAYHFDGKLFTGDTLFAAGCGRFFEGDAKDMRAAFDAIEALPLGTLIFPGHEYTVKNLEFAVYVEPSSSAAISKLLEAKHQRELGLPTIPTTLEAELTYNPFLRSPRLASVIASRTGRSPGGPVEALAELRRWKDQFSSAYQRAGGRFGVLGMLRDFYDHVFADPMIGFMFQKSDKERLIEKEHELVADALGQPTPYTGRPMRPTHARFKITGGQFERRMVLLEDAMRRNELPADAITLVLAHARAVRQQITEEAGSSCHSEGRS